MFDLNGKTALITGGCGLLGVQHAEAILEFGGEVILTDVISDTSRVIKLKEKYGTNVSSVYMDVTDKSSIQKVVDKFEKIDILINNAALDPKVEDGLEYKNKFEHLDLDSWNKTLDVILNGTFLCSQVVVNKMLSTGLESEYCRDGGVILNIASDLSIISPDQRIYGDGVKPASYGVAKAGVVNLTKYLSTYLAKKNIRVNSLSPAGVYNNQSDEFVSKFRNLIPMDRMAKPDEYKGAIVFMCSDASSFMTGHNLVIDGGRTIW
jgi:NAD(P)-dependent dehydrogenase (short-subunit alcohol dehydrogenase family)|tara:strand:- start:17 stop:808 length:792 start_codon:yes stop_codon:yes gene_type:complete